jgi:hypothetical protein
MARVAWLTHDDLDSSDIDDRREDLLLSLGATIMTPRPENAVQIRHDSGTDQPCSSRL